VGLWAALMIGSGIHVYKRNIPTSLKVIHARMVAQGGVIAGLCGVGIYSLVTERSAPRFVAHRMHKWGGGGGEGGRAPGGAKWFVVLVAWFPPPPSPPSPLPPVPPPPPSNTHAPSDAPAPLS
jgi:hypothetical protein